MAEAIFLNEKTSLAEDIRYGLSLRGADLDEDLTFWRQEPADPRSDAPIGFEPVGTTVESKMRIVTGDV